MADPSATDTLAKAPATGTATYVATVDDTLDPSDCPAHRVLNGLPRNT